LAGSRRFDFQAVRLLVRLGECHIARLVLYLPVAALPNSQRRLRAALRRVGLALFLAQPIILIYSAVASTHGHAWE
jgi:hypothetical protein